MNLARDHSGSRLIVMLGISVIFELL